MRYLLLILFFSLQTFGFGANAIDLKENSFKKELTSKKSSLEERSYKQFRYYAPDEGVYISQDPIRLEGNNPNFYAYTHDSNFQIDPFGLKELYALIANKDGWYPVMEWGKKQPIGEMFLKKGELWKIGETKNPTRRYTQKWLRKMNLDKVTMFNGPRKLMQMLESMKLKGHLAWKGFLPPGNKVCH